MPKELPGVGLLRQGTGMRHVKRTEMQIGEKYNHKYGVPFESKPRPNGAIPL